MKQLLNMTLASSLLFLGSNAIEAKTLTENQKLTECKALASTQLKNVKKVKLINLKNKRSGFKAKLKVISADERATFLCTIQNGDPIQIARLDKK